MQDLQFGYDPHRLLAPNLWEIRGAWKNKLGRRMTVARLQNGDVFIHNAIRLHEDELEWLRSLGNVRYIVAPNDFHCSDAGWMAKRFTEAAVFVTSAKIGKLREEGVEALDVNRDFPVLDDMEFIPMSGTRMHEAAFFHKTSRTLILCDLAFNMEADAFTGFEKTFMSWNKVGGWFGPTRLTKFLFTKNKRDLLGSYRELLQRDFDRVIVNHGAVLDTGGKRALKAGIERIFGKI